MAGHSQFKNIMYRKGAQDAKRAKVFTKIIRELTVSAKMGSPDPATNPRLRAAIMAARDANMPKDTMERAIKREKQLKNWHRPWKINLINEHNPHWADLAVGLGLPPLGNSKPPDGP